MKSKTTAEILILNEIRIQISDKTPEGVVDQIALQIKRCREATAKIDKEGIVVRDLKGSVIPHPAIKIEIDSGKIISDLLTKHRK